VKNKLDAVRAARAQLGDAPAAEVAAFVQQHFGITLPPAIATVLMASLREREHLEATWLQNHEALQQALAEQASKKARRKVGSHVPPREVDHANHRDDQREAG